MIASIRGHLPAWPTGRRPSLLWRILATVVAAAVAATMLLIQASPASAHCDSREGPVVTAAKNALDARDVKLILPYVKADQEQELTMAFEQTLAIRNRGPEVQAVADEYFYETAVRLHRIGEGASYTGIKDEAAENPSLDAAEASLEKGTPDAVIQQLDKELQNKVSERFRGVLDARAAEKADPSVETSRERVEAELMFEKYVLGISGAINEDVSHEGEAGGSGGEGH
jgi:hypothetical protein